MQPPDRNTPEISGTEENFLEPVRNVGGDSGVLEASEAATPVEDFVHTAGLVGG